MNVSVHIDLISAKDLKGHVCAPGRAFSTSKIDVHTANTIRTVPLGPMSDVSACCPAGQACGMAFQMAVNMAPGTVVTVEFVGEGAEGPVSVFAQRPDGSREYVIPPEEFGTLVQPSAVATPMPVVKTQALVRALSTALFTSRAPLTNVPAVVTVGAPSTAGFPYGAVVGGVLAAIVVCGIGLFFLIRVVKKKYASAFDATAESTVYGVAPSLETIDSLTQARFAEVQPACDPMMIKQQSLPARLDPAPPKPPKRGGSHPVVDATHYGEAPHLYDTQYDYDLEDFVSARDEGRPVHYGNAPVPDAPLSYVGLPPEDKPVSYVGLPPEEQPKSYVGLPPEEDVSVYVDLPLEPQDDDTPLSYVGLPPEDMPRDTAPTTTVSRTPHRAHIVSGSFAAEW